MNSVLNIFHQIKWVFVDMQRQVVQKNSYETHPGPTLLIRVIACYYAAARSAQNQ